MVNLKKHLDLLGMRVEDRVTGLSGIVTTIAFDLYGCIQAIVHPGQNKEGALADPLWFDVARLRVTGGEPVMPRPEFDWSAASVSAGGKGPAERPRTGKT